jgi:hypothetical protein
VERILESSPQRQQGKNYLDVVERYITACVPLTPLSFIQIGKQSPTLSTNILFDVKEVECWVRDTGTKGEDKTKGQEKSEMLRDYGDARQEIGTKRRKIKDANKKDFMGLLEGM